MRGAVPDSRHSTCARYGEGSLDSLQQRPDDVLDYYPVDRMMHDIALALMAVQTQTTEILDEFPTKAAKTEEAETLQS